MLQNIDNFFFNFLFRRSGLTSCVRSNTTSKRIEQESPITSQIKENFKAVQLGLTTIHNVFFYFVKVIWDSIAKVCWHGSDTA